MDPGKDSSRSLSILYATETGTAQDYADRIARECRRIHFTSRVLNMNSYIPTELISEHLIVFVVSTTDSGVEPRSMTALWNMLLRSDLPTDLFDEIEFAVFGLGDTAYEKFCWPAKKLCRRMQSLGAKEVCTIGEGDEQHRLGIDGAFDPWMRHLLDTLLHLYSLPAGLGIVPSDSLPPPRVTMLDASATDSEDVRDPLEADEKYYRAVVHRNQRITPEDWFQDVRHMEFKFQDDLEYEPGDVAVIHPEASLVDVDSFLSSIGWGNIADDPFTIEQRDSDQSLPDHLPKVATLRTLFTHHVDFNAVPRRAFFQLLKYFTTDDTESEKLGEFISEDGAEDLYEYCFRVKRTIKEVLTEFRSAEIPREYIFDIFPPMRPRQFSIASSIKIHPKEIHLCVAIVRYRTKLKMPRRGVCTTYLAALREGGSLQIGIQKGLFSLPKDKDTPLICIGPGTGIAPMRAVIEARIYSGSSHNTLYFGCRSAAKDQHYHADWSSYAADGTIAYRVACSRDGPEGAKRTYVQDLMRDDSERIWELVGNRGAWVFISGSSNKMPAGVKEAIRFSAEKCGDKSGDEARDFVATMERDRRLVEECWS